MINQTSLINTKNQLQINLIIIHIIRNIFSLCIQCGNDNAKVGEKLFLQTIMQYSLKK